MPLVLCNDLTFTAHLRQYLDIFMELAWSSGTATRQPGV